MPHKRRSKSKGRGRKPSSTTTTAHLQDRFQTCPPEFRGSRSSLRQRRHIVEEEEVPGTTIKVFLYGTMKTNFSNYNAYLSCAVSRGQAVHVYPAHTVSTFDLLLWGDRDVPGMVDALPSNGGHRIQGEVFEVDQNTLAALDDFFEDGPALYRRRLIKVTPTAAPTSGGGGESEATSGGAVVEALPQMRRRRDNDNVYCWLLQHMTTGDQETDEDPPVLLSNYTLDHEKTYTNPTFQPNVLEVSESLLTATMYWCTLLSK